MKFRALYGVGDLENPFSVIARRQLDLWTNGGELTLSYGSLISIPYPQYTMQQNRPGGHSTVQGIQRASNKIII